MLARLIVALRFLIVPAWIAGAIWVSFSLPSIFGAESNDLGSLLPRNSEAIKVEEKGIEVFGLPVLSRTMVVAHQQGDFTLDQGKAAARFIAKVDGVPERSAELRAVPLLDAPGLLESKRLGSTLVVYLYIDPALAESEQVEAVDGFASELQQATSAETVHVTGAVPASRAETNIANQDLLWVTLATIALVLTILALYFRSVGIPLLGLGTVAIAYQVTDHVLGWASQRYSISIPREVDPVIVALLFGVLTDYLVFFASDYRRHLQEGLNSCEAVTEVTTELLPVISTAALMIAGATLTLLLSGVRFLSAFGPGMAVAVVVGAAVALTFIPAMLAIFGRMPALAELSRTRRRAGRTRRSAGRAAGWSASPRTTRRSSRSSAWCCCWPRPADCASSSSATRSSAACRTRPTCTRATRSRAKTSVRGGRADDADAGRTGDRRKAAAAGLAAAGTGRTEGGGGSDRAGAGTAGQTPLRDPRLRKRERRPLRPRPQRRPRRRRRRRRSSPTSKTRCRRWSRKPGSARRTIGMTGDTSIASELSGDTWTAFERVAPAALLVLLVLLWVLLRSRIAPLYWSG